MSGRGERWKNIAAAAMTLACTFVLHVESGSLRVGLSGAAAADFGVSRVRQAVTADTSCKNAQCCLDKPPPEREACCNALGPASTLCNQLRTAPSGGTAQRSTPPSKGSCKNAQCCLAKPAGEQTSCCNALAGSVRSVCHAGIAAANQTANDSSATADAVRARMGDSFRARTYEEKLRDCAKSAPPQIFVKMSRSAWTAACRKGVEDEKEGKIDLLGGCPAGAKCFLGCELKVSLSTVNCLWERAKDFISGTLKPLVLSLKDGARGILKWAAPRLQSAGQFLLEVLGKIPPFSIVVRLKDLFDAIRVSCDGKTMPGCVVKPVVQAAVGALPEPLPGVIFALVNKPPAGKSKVDMVKKAILDSLGPVGKIFAFVEETAGTLIARLRKGESLSVALPGALRDAAGKIEHAASAKLASLKGKVEAIFDAFGAVLQAPSFEWSGVQNFARTTANALDGIAGEVVTTLGLEEGLVGKALRAMVPLATGALTVGAGALAAVHHGLVKLMGWIIPKLITGAGDAYNYVNDKLPPQFAWLRDKLSAVLPAAGAAGGGLIGMALSDPAARERVKATFLRIADVTGRIRDAIDGAKKLADAVDRGSFSDMEAAVVAQQATKTELTESDIPKLVAGLLDFAREQVTARLQPKLRELLTKALSLMDRVLDTPRNTLVAAVGSIPVLGGILSAVLNVGLGLVVDKMKEFLSVEVEKLAEKYLRLAVSQIEAQVTEALTKKSAQSSVQGFAGLLQTVRRLADEVSTTLTAAAAGMRGSVKVLLRMGLRELLFRGVNDKALRDVLAAALDALGDKLGAPGFTLTQAAVEVLRSLADPLAKLLARPIADATLKAAVQQAVATLLRALAAPTGVQRLLKDPGGPLASLARELLSKLRPVLSAWLLKKVTHPTARRAAEKALDALQEEIGERGFAGLLQFPKLLDRLGVALARLLFDALVEELRSGAAEAKATLQALAELVPDAGTARTDAQQLVGSLKTGITRNVDTVARCRAEITSFDGAMVGRVVGCLKSTLLGAVAEVAGALRGGLGRFVALVGYDVAAARKVLIDAAAGLSVEQRRTVARAAALLHEGMRILTRDFAQCDAGGDRGEPSKLRALTCISTLIIQASGGR